MPRSALFLLLLQLPLGTAALTLRAHGRGGLLSVLFQDKGEGKEVTNRLRKV